MLAKHAVRAAWYSVCIFATLFSYGCLCGDSGKPPELTHPGLRRITDTGEFNQSDPAWSPDGQWLVVVGERGQLPVREIQLVEIATGNVTQLTEENDLSSNNGAPDWSPDGGHILFTSDEFGQYGVGFLDLDSKQMTYLAYGYEAEWSPDGEKVAVAGPPPPDFVASDSADTFEIIVRDLRSGQNQSIFSLVTPNVWLGGMDWGNGNQIAISFQAREDAYPTPYNRDILMVNGDGSGLSGIIATEEDETSPTWSPDGKMIAYAKGDHPLERYLWVSNADGSCTLQLMDVEGIVTPAWSPDGQKIAFAHYGYLYLLDSTVEPIAERLKRLDCRE
jgi:Tol biopolymer transport system component